MKKDIGKGFSEVIITFENGRSECYFDIKDREEFAIHIKKKYLPQVKEFCRKLKNKTDKIILELKRIDNIRSEEFIKFLDSYAKFVGFYTIQRNLVDYASDEEKKAIINDLTETRKYTEFVPMEVEKQMQRMNKDKNILFLMRSELPEFVETGMLPKNISDREKCLMHFKSDEFKLFTQDEADKKKKELIKINKEDIIKGQVAFKGIAKGRARIIQNPKNYDIFDEGDILITGMTRPEYFPLMEKAGAIITDLGGILCHAAIVAREIGKPCIIGTKHATQIFKDGDYVEVDANKGIVRKLPINKQ
ncbi:PEP-utilizing enzyme [Bacteroidota bacterium]